uniref:HTH La-type RNA-binding domain-containing protein n=1 Tax=Steinernema glaseri TaxID=37863 RepID=A0A1I7Z2K3_9BILA
MIGTGAEGRPQKKAHVPRDTHFQQRRPLPYTVADAISDPMFKNSEEAPDQQRSTNIVPTGHHQNGWRGHRRNGRHPNAPPPLPREEHNALGALPGWDDAGEDDDFDYMAYRDALLAQRDHVVHMPDQQVPVFPHAVFLPPTQPVHFNPHVYVPQVVVPPMYTVPKVLPAVVAAAQVQRMDRSLEYSIRKQVEYYFSKNNLSTDHYLRSQMDKEGYVPLSLIAGFPRFGSLTRDISVIATALSVSKELEVDKEGQRVRTRDNPEKWPTAH